MGGGGGYTCLSEDVVEHIEAYMILHDSYKAQGSNLQVTLETLQGMAKDAVISPLLPPWNIPVSEVREHFDTISVEGLR